MVHRFYRPTEAARQHDLRDELPAFLPVLADAASILGNRVAILAEDRFTLDGQPASLKLIIIEANKKRAQYAMKPLPYPGVNPLLHRDGAGMRLVNQNIGEV